MSTKKKPGRPKGGDKIPMCVNLPRIVANAIRKRSKDTGISISRIVEDAVRKSIL